MPKPRSERVDRVFLFAYFACLAVLFLAGAPLWAFIALGVAGFLIGWWLG